MFYHFDQNNSGGRFYNDDRVCNHVIIEAAPYAWPTPSKSSSMSTCNVKMCLCKGHSQLFINLPN